MIKYLFNNDAGILEAQASEVITIKDILHHYKELSENDSYPFSLKVLIDWPQTWLEWDVLFLRPWPSFAPWITPAVIAFLFVVWGGRILLSEYEPRFNWLTGCLFVAGALLGLTAFLLPAAPLLPQGEAAFLGYMPDAFAWGLYLPGLLSMALGLFITVRVKSKV